MNKDWLKMTREEKLEKRLEEKDVEMEIQRECYESIIRKLENKLAMAQAALSL
jgi:hypothetical protein